MRRMTLRRRVPARAAAAGLAFLVSACAFDSAPTERPPRNTLFIGIDVSGSFHATGNYDDALDYAARYIHAHLRGLGGLEEPRSLFVGSIGGEKPGEPQAFHPIHDFREKTVEEIRSDLRTWFPPDADFTDFNAYFRRASALVKRQNLVLAPITIVLLTDGVPDVGAAARADDDPAAPYRLVDVSPLEYLSRNVTLRLLYPQPPVAVHWEQDVPRARVRIWTVDQVVMAGWQEQLEPDLEPAAQADFLKWTSDNVDFRVRSSIF